MEKFDMKVMFFFVYSNCGNFRSIRENEYSDIGNIVVRNLFDVLSF